MVRRLITISAWVLASAISIPVILGFFIGTFISPGLGRTDTAEIAAALGMGLLTLVASIYIGILGYRGQLPGTSHWGPSGEKQARGRGIMGKAFAFLGVVIASSAVSAIVAATVVTDYVPEIYQRQFHAGEIDWIITVESEVLRETRDLRVKVPKDYVDNPDRRYPVLLVLDGEWQLDHSEGASSTLELLGLGEPMIVVGVVNGVAGRSVDFVPSEYVDDPARADRFLEFLENEALPAIDGELRTNSTRVLAGYSLGGLFTVYTLVRRPDLFVGRFALSPSLWRGDQEMVSDLERFLEASPELDSYFYTSLGSRESGSMQDGFNALREALETRAPSGLRWEATLVEGADHGNNSWRSTPPALMGFWEFWRDTRGRPGGSEGAGR